MVQYHKMPNGKMMKGKTHNDFSNIDKGSFTDYAKRKGKTPSQMATIVLKNPSKYRKLTVKRANLAKNFAKMRKGKKKGTS